MECSSPQRTSGRSCDSCHAILLRLGRLQLPLRNGFSHALQAVTLGPVLPRRVLLLGFGCSAEAAACSGGSLAAGAASGFLGAAFRPAFDDVFEGRPALVFGLKNCVIGPKPCSVAATWDFGRRLNGGILARFVPLIAILKNVSIHEPSNKMEK